jgi:hypothetical protein
LFLPFEQALELKKLGFDDPTYGYYRDSDKHLFNMVYYDESYDNLTKAPLYQQAFRWFREKRGLWFRPDYYDEGRTDYSGSIHRLGVYSSQADVAEFESAEEARLGALIKIIEIVKDEK